ncbi:hypothetical protein Mgra_00007380 [Meloidogyne graminicola]|uniref:Uncharacterized protein n=1 Tax=Meloidogyne graminicola TaxID=189291 RepID=A0A8S9ZII1_9BILA|nr:hypothetical protein Mgra_00007380 [Meloidogyne graminicola]
MSSTIMDKKIKQQKIKEIQQNNNNNKLRLRDTLLNMLGEFVALNKSPEVRLSTASQQFLADAVLEEKRNLDKDYICRHTRSVSSNAVLANPSNEQLNNNNNIHHSRHISLPPINQEYSNRFNLFPQRFRKVAQADERISCFIQQQKQLNNNNIIKEENEEENEQQKQQNIFNKTKKIKKEEKKKAVAI